MYYSYTCPSCGRVFYTYSTSKEEAAKTMYHGLMKHMEDYKEDIAMYDMDEGEYKEEHQLYYHMKESEEAPDPAYELR